MNVDIIPESDGSEFLRGEVDPEERRVADALPPPELDLVDGAVEEAVLPEGGEGFALGVLVPGVRVDGDGRAAVAGFVVPDDGVLADPGTGEKS